MLISVLKLIFIAIVFTYIFMTVYGKIFVFRKEEPQFVSDYCATMAGLIGIYVLLLLIFALIVPSVITKAALLIFAAAPFIIGLLANFYTEKYYTILQIFLFIISTYYVVI